MNDRRAVIIGLVILLVIATYPFWYSLAVGGSTSRPQLELPAGETQCVEDRDYMAANHMNLLSTWRDAVVREGRQTYTSNTYGKTYEMSLTRTCIECHGDREAFCQRCHSYADVSPYCWDCHLDTKGL